MFGEPIFLDMFCAHRNPPMTIVATTGGNGPALLDLYCFYLLTTIQPLPSPRATSTEISCLDWKTDILVWGTRTKDAAPPVRVEDAHPAIVSKRQFRRVNKLLGSRAPKKVHPRRSASPYLLSGLLRCETCGKAITAAEAKSGKYTYYVCHSLLKRGSRTCKTPRLNAKSFEKLIVDEIRANVLTESNIRDLVKLLDEEMDGVAAEQRQRLETIEEELEDVKRRLGRIWQVIETTDIEMADASERIKEHRDRKEKLEVAAGERGRFSRKAVSSSTAPTPSPPI